MKCELQSFLPINGFRARGGWRPVHSCPVCERTEFAELFFARDQHYGIKGDYRVVRCKECSLVFLNPMLTARQLRDLYPDDYYAYQDNFHTQKWKQPIKKVLGYYVLSHNPDFSAPGTMLDLGCGSGWFMDGMREQGWTTYGVEVNEGAVQRGRAIKGLNIFCGTLQEAGFPSELFDYVRLNHSFEHMNCPNETLSEIHRVLKPGGQLFIGVPNVRSLTSRVFKQYWWHLCAPVHPFSYAANTLSRLLVKHGFVVKCTRFNSDYFGLLGSFQIWLNRHSARKSMQGAFVNNYGLRLLCQWGANIADMLGQGDMIETISVKAR